MARQSPTAAALEEPRRAPQRPAAPYLSLLNFFELRFRGQEVTLPRSAQRLLAFLALHDRAQPRVLVAYTLWVDASEERAFANLRSSLWRANRCGHRLVESDGSRLGLASSVTVDLRRAYQDAHRLLGPASDDDVEKLVETLFEAELLPDWYEDWVLVERERFRQLRLHALEAACDQLIRGHRFGAAVAAGLAAAAAEPLRESAHRALIRAHLAEGNPTEALRQYRTYRQVLGASLGVGPSSEMEKLVAELTL